MEICSSSSRKKQIPPPRNKHHHHRAELTNRTHRTSSRTSSRQRSETHQTGDDVHKETFFNRVFKREHKLLWPTCQYVQTQASRLVAGASKVVCRIFGAVRQTQADVSRLDLYFHRLAGCILRPPRSDSSAMDARGPLYSRGGHSFATSSADHRICCAACIVPTPTLASTATSLTLSCW